MKFKIFCVLTPLLLSLYVQAAHAKTEISSNTALRLIFGKYDSNRKAFIHTLSLEERKEFEITATDKDTFYTTIATIKPFKQNGIDKYFVVTETKNELFECHACAPIIGLAVLKKENNIFKIEDKHQYIEKIGTFGQLNVMPTVIEIGNNNFGLEFDDGYSGMGITTSSVILVAKYNNSYKSVLNSDEFYEDNSGACGSDIGRPCYSFNSKISFDKKNKSEYYPITITTSGTRLNEKNKLEKFKDVKNFNFLNGIYKRK